MKSKIVCLILFVILLLFLTPVNTFAQTPPINLSFGIPITEIASLSLGILGQIFGLTSWGMNIDNNGVGFNFTLSIPMGFIFDYEGKEPVKFYMFTPIMAGKYAKFYPRIELVNDFDFFGLMDIDYSIFGRLILPITIEEKVSSFQPFFGTGALFVIGRPISFLIDIGFLFQASIVTFGINYKIYIRKFIGHKILFKFSIYF